jgi:hypothetical protein
MDRLGRRVTAAQSTTEQQYASLHGLARLFIDGIYLDQADLSEMIEQMIKNLRQESSTSA